MEHVSSRAAAPPTSALAVLARLPVRIGVGLWQNRGSALVLLGALAAVSAFTLLAPSSPQAQSAGQAAVAPAADCADTAMAAIAQNSDATVQRAYECMEPTYQERVSEQQFADQFAASPGQGSGAAVVDKLARVADYRARDGAQMVYYALSAGNENVGYIVYLDPEGKVAKVE
jgi:hypothetical protein